NQNLKRIKRPERSRHALENRLPSHEFYGQLGGIKVKIATKTCKTTNAGRRSRFNAEIAAGSAGVIVGNRLLVGEAHVPGEVDPGVLADLGDEGVDHRPALRLGVDGREMRLRHHG